MDFMLVSDVKNLDIFFYFEMPCPRYLFPMISIPVF
jgi:hypothetical protein